MRPRVWILALGVGAVLLSVRHGGALNELASRPGLQKPQDSTGPERLAAGVMSDEELQARRALFLGKAEAWASRAEDYENPGRLCFNFSVSTERLKIFCDRMRDVSREIERKYRFAAYHPSLPVEPDPEMPEP